MIELLYSIIVVCGIGTILAFLLEMAYTYLGDYGERRITINNEKELVINGGRSLLVSLSDENIHIPSACGGKGTCSYCKVKVHEGGGPLLPTESPYLSDTEKQDHVRLACQLKIKEDLKIEIPEELFLVKEFRAIVTGITELTPEIKEVSLDIISPEEGISFRPGQYVQLEVPKYKMTRGPEFRAYSIASSADNHNKLDLIITKAPKGAVSTYVHEYLKKGDELSLYGPHGDFFLRESVNDILLISTGSGLAPMISMLRQIETERIQRKTRLFFGCSSLEDLYYFEDLKDIEKKLVDFTYTPTLSRPEKQDHWQGEVGRVTDLIEKYVNKDDALDVYLCGSPEMVESCMSLLIAKGISEECIFFDKFE